MCTDRGRLHIIDTFWREKVAWQPGRHVIATSKYHME